MSKVSDTKLKTKQIVKKHRGDKSARIAVLQDIPAIMGLMKTACEEDAQHPMDEIKVFNMIVKL
jgi:hypothetical protein